jgi:glycosyltransferase involved in cell wall biosynthesis
LTNRPDLTVLTPVFEDGRSFARLCLALSAIQLNRDIKVLAIDDGSISNPPQLSAYKDAGLSGAILRLRRNVGHQAAIATGIAYLAEKGTSADLIIMDSDGEDNPSAISALLERLSEGYHVAVATRAKRSESIWFRSFYATYKLLFRGLTGHDLRFGNFMALSPIALSRLAAMHETRIHLASSVLASRLRIVDVGTKREKRYFGRSKMNFTSLVLHGMRSVMVFGETVLTRIALTCVTVVALCLLLAASAAVLKITGHATPGWFTTVIGLSIIIMTQTAVLTAVVLVMTIGLARGSGPTSILDVEEYKLEDPITSTDMSTHE